MASLRGLRAQKLAHQLLPRSRCRFEALLPLAPTSTCTRQLNPRITTTTTRRHYSAPKQPPDEPALSKLPDLSASKLTIEQTSHPKLITPPEELIFGRTFTDHMLSAEWTASDGWLPPRITPYQNLSLDPATSVLHYAFTAFEGTKAYKDAGGNVRLFRPDRNMARLNKSAARIALPKFSPEGAIDLIKQFVKLEERHIPSAKGYSLYLRPTLIGTQRSIGVGPPASALLYVIASPVGPYYPSGFKAISLSADSSTVRAWPGGAGQYKIGANYAPCIVPQMEAATHGYHQNLWLFRDDTPEGKGEDYVTEVGTMNLFAAFKTRDGRKELVTPPLDGTILEGVTRDSIVQLARERLTKEGWEMNERRFTMRELAEASQEGRLMEVFGAGTAAVVAPVRSIAWKGQVLDCNLPAGKEAGELARMFTNWVNEIQYGDVEHPWSVLA